MITAFGIFHLINSSGSIAPSSITNLKLVVALVWAINKASVLFNILCGDLACLTSPAGKGVPTCSLVAGIIGYSDIGKTSS